jgi:AGCS family alanine or glycine:cation symporter
MLEKINLILWGYGTIALIMSTGLYFSVKIGFAQLFLPKILKNTLFAKREETGGGISRFQALSTALAASMGTGNIVGVAAAIAVGGPGAVFWMWVSAFLGMGTAYAENYLGVTYKNKSKSKFFGAMAYLEKGLGSRKFACVFAAAAVLASFGVGNMVQSNAISNAIGASFSADDKLIQIATGVITAIVAGIFILGGTKRIAAAVEKIIPIISLFYIIGAIIVIILNMKNIPNAFFSILSGAFGINSITGGISGAMIKRAVTVGLARGIFSNEAGMGSSVFAHTETNCSDGAVMGMWAMLEVFIDTIICCTLTAFVILSVDTTGGLLAESNISTAVQTAFESGLGAFAGIFIRISTVIFAFATILGWCFYGEKSMGYLTKNSIAKRSYSYLYIAVIAVGAVSSVNFVWQLSDIFNALMLILNIFGLMYLHKEVQPPD